MKTILIVCLGVACCVFIVEQASAIPSAKIVAPSGGSELYFGGFVEIELRNLRLEEVQFLLVELAACPREEEWGCFPLLVCGRSALARVGDSVEPECIFLTWINQEAGRAKLNIPWNFIPDNFSPGLYYVRAKVYIVHANVISYWTVTDWHLLNLQKTPMPLVVEILSPAPGALYTEAPLSLIEFKGRIYTASPPVEVTIEATRPGKGWQTVEKAITQTEEFAISVESAKIVQLFEGFLGEYSFRIAAKDNKGKTAYSHSIPLEIKKPPVPVVRIILDRSAPFFAGDSLRFAFLTEPVEMKMRWRSVKWSFGDGVESTEWSPIHIYSKPGVYTVQLEVMDETGFTLRDLIKIEVQEKVIVRATRKIWGYPVCGDAGVAIGVLRGGNIQFKVEVTIALFEEVAALSVHEVLPEGWRTVHSELRADNMPSIEYFSRGNSWLIVGRDGPIPKGTIVMAYTFSVDERALLGEVVLVGHVIATVSPRQEVKALVVGDQKVKVVDRLPLYVALLFVVEDGPNFKLSAPEPGQAFKLTAAHMDLARRFWEQSEARPVPFTGNRVLTLDDYRKLHALYVWQMPITQWLELCECMQP